MCELFKAMRWRRSAHRSVHLEFFFFFLKKWNNVLMSYILHIYFCLGLTLLCIDRRPLCPMATLLTCLKSWSPKAFFGLALFAADKSLAICVFLQVLWHPVSISVLCSCDSCVSEVADPLTETVRTLNISTQKPFFSLVAEIV